MAQLYQEKKLDPSKTPESPDLLFLFIVTNKNPLSVQEKFLQCNDKSLQKELLVHALLHNKGMFMQLAASCKNLNEIVDRTTLTTYLQKKYVKYKQELTTQQNINTTSRFANIRIITQDSPQA